LTKWFTSHRWIALLMGVLLFAWSFSPTAEQFEHLIYSQLVSLVPPVDMPDKTVVVTIDSSPSSAGRVSYTELATLLDYLKSAGSRAIGLSLPLDQSQTVLDETSLSLLREALKARKRGSQKGGELPSIKELEQQLDPDTQLAETLSSSNSIILGVSNAMSGGVTPLKIESPTNSRNDISNKGQAMMLPVMAAPPFRYVPGPAPLAIFTNSVPLAMQMTESENLFENLVAATPLAMPFGDQYLPTFELVLAARSLRVPVESVKIRPGHGVILGKTWYHTDAGMRVYPRQAKSMTAVYAADEVLAGKWKKQLRGRTVLVGMTSDQKVRLPGGREVIPLVATAHAINALISESLVKVPYWSQGAQRGALLLILIYLLLVPVRLRGWIGLALGLGLVLLLLNGSLLLLILKNTWIPMALPVLFLLTGQVMVWVHHRFAHSFSRVRSERDKALVELAELLRSQGKPDKAFDRLKGCVKGDLVMDALYQVGLEYERRRQFSKALVAYDHIAQWNPYYRDIANRRARHQAEATPSSLAATMISHTATTLVVDDPVVERPVLGRYEIERELGRGAMGTVYLGRDPRIGRTVAIKTLALTEEFESTQLNEVRRRFFQEAETAGRLSHPSIVTIYDVGEEHDLAYIAMDYIQGDSLEQHVRQGELLPMEDVFTVGIQVAEALEYAHEQNVVHRDVKPGNIIYDRDKCQLKVTDFGIACLTDNSKTRTGTVLGSPYYMSPEQIAGKKVDGRSDLFSLGVTLYQLFSGQLPFEGDSLTNLMYQITHNKPASIRSARSELPSCLTRIINRALEKKPAKRFADGGEMAEALRRCAERSGIGYYAGKA